MTSDSIATDDAEMFDLAPVSLWLEDYSGLRRLFDIWRGEGVTGADGTFRFSLPADVSADPLSQTFTLEVGVTDENGQAVGDAKGVVVHKGQFYIGMKPDDYVANAGQDASVSLVTTDRDGKPNANTAADWSPFTAVSGTERPQVSSVPQAWVVGTLAGRNPGGSPNSASSPGSQSRVSRLQSCVRAAHCGSAANVRSRVSRKTRKLSIGPQASVPASRAARTAGRLSSAQRSLLAP